MWWKYIKGSAFVLAGALLLTLIRGAVIEPRLVDFKEESATIPHLPPAWEGKSVAFALSTDFI